MIAQEHDERRSLNSYGLHCHVQHGAANEALNMHCMLMRGDAEVDNWAFYNLLEMYLFRIELLTSHGSI